jgi:hypothetical protein
MADLLLTLLVVNRPNHRATPSLTQLAAGVRRFFAASDLSARLEGVFSKSPSNLRSAPVPGRSNVRESKSHKIMKAWRRQNMAAAGDGRTPQFKTSSSKKGGRMVPSAWF